jgi:hypothetical protein
MKKQMFLLLFLYILLFVPIRAAAQAESPDAQTESPAVPEEERTEAEMTDENGAESSDKPKFETLNDPLNRWLYLGLRMGGAVRFYTLPPKVELYTSNYAQGLSFEAAFQAGFRFLSFMSLQGEVIFTHDKALFRRSFTNEDPDKAKSYVTATDDFSSLSLMFPVLLKFHLRRDPFLISPFAGAYWIIPLGQIEQGSTEMDDTISYDYSYEPSMGIMGGLAFGFLVGPGDVFVDLRFSLDLGDTVIQMTPDMSYKRAGFSLTAGYEFALFNKKRRVSK